MEHSFAGAGNALARPDLMLRSEVGTVRDPLWSLPDLDAEIAADLKAAGVQVAELDANAPDIGQANRDAWASMLMRQMSQIDRLISTDEEALKQEVAMLTARYGMRLGRLREARERLDMTVRVLAEQSINAGTWGKKRSKAVGYGSYGARKAPDTIQIDEAVALPECMERFPDLVQVTLRLPLTVARGRFTDPELGEHAADFAIRKAAVKQYLETAGSADGTTLSAVLPKGIAKATGGDRFFSDPLPAGA